MSGAGLERVSFGWGEALVVSKSIEYAFRITAERCGKPREKVNLFHTFLLSMTRVS